MLEMFWVHTVTVKTRTGQNAIGDVWSDPVTVACFVNDTTHLVRGVTDEAVISQTTVYAPMQTALDDGTRVATASLFTNDSIVTVNGRDARLITVNANDAGTLPLPSYVEIHLT